MPVIKHLEKRYSFFERDDMKAIFKNWLLNIYRCRDRITELMNKIEFSPKNQCGSIDFEKILSKVEISKYIHPEIISYENYDSVCLAAKFYGTNLENFVEIITSIINKDLIKDKLINWRLVNLYSRIIYLAESTVLLVIGKLFYYFRMGVILCNINMDIVDNVALRITNLMISGSPFTYDNICNQIDFSDIVNELKHTYKIRRLVRKKDFERSFMTDVEQICKIFRPTGTNLCYNTGSIHIVCYGQVL